MIELTPTERLTIMSLTLTPNQTVAELQASTGTKTLKHLVRALRTLTMARMIAASDAVVPTYSIPA